ncbi:NAD(P)-binding domain-containing protein [Longibacter sp.]|uniref:NAD(P)-binding domain-containing protein n=1 Tax=Longibacter sp. TaxID=2045415 RepID=UPI003EBF67CB
MTNRLPIAIIGAGPVGLAAASHLLERGETPLVFEAGPDAATAVREWQHVRLFSPWKYNIDDASRRLLREAGWVEPDPNVLPTGRDLREQYLRPLATRTRLARHIQYKSRVVAITRDGRDKMKTADRGSRPFTLKIESDGGTVWKKARAVIDASGTWFTPNPAGASGVAVPGEEAHSAHITYGIPDVLRANRDDYAGQDILVLGGGHSAMNVVLDLVTLQEVAPDTRVIWARRSTPTEPDDFGGGRNDALAARGALGQQAYAAIQDGRVDLVSPFLTHAIKSNHEAAPKLRILGEQDGSTSVLHADQLVVATGFRPDLDILREVRIDIDPVTESVADLAPLIDPNLHSCGTVPPHGVDELTHPEKDVFIVGMKSYGRAPTFLMATGYEQVRSIAAHLTGDDEAATRIELTLPETGVCSAPAPVNEADENRAGSCCAPVPRVRRAAESATVSSSSCCA